MKVTLINKILLFVILLVLSFDCVKATGQSQSIQLDSIKNIINEINKKVIALYYTLTEMNVKLGDYSKTRTYLDEVCIVSEKYNILNAKFNCYYGNLLHHEGTKNYEKAFYYSETYHELNDNIYSPEMNSKIANFKANQDLEEKEISKLQQPSGLLSNRINLAILSFFSLLLLSAFLVLRHRNREEEAIRQIKIIESMLAVMQSQINPYFLFNAFTVVQNFILKSNIIETYKYLNKLALLRRQIVSITNNIYINLTKEITFLQDYLELKKVRFRIILSTHFLLKMT